MNFKILSLLVVISCSVLNENKDQTMTLSAPKAKKIAHEINQLGEKRVDYYHWLRDKNWQSFIKGDLNFHNPKIKEYLDNEVAYTEYKMRDTKDIQDKIYQELILRVNESDETYPLKYKEYFYYTKEFKELNYPIFCRKKNSLDSEEEVYFDVNEEAKGKKLFQLKAGAISPNNRFYAYAYNLTGSMSGTIKVRDLKTGRDFSWEIPNTTASLAWDQDSEHLFYVLRDSTGRGKAVYKINIFKGLGSKKLIFDKPKDRQAMFMGVRLSTSERFLSIFLSDQGSNEIYLLDLENEKRGLRLLASSENGVNYYFTHAGDHIYILTNHDKATDFKVMRTTLDKIEKENWTLYLSEQEGFYKDSISGFKDYLVLEIKNNNKALSEILVINLKTGLKKKIAMKEDAYSIYFKGAMDYDTQNVRYYYQSPLTPKQTIDYDLESGESKIKKIKNIPHYKKDDYELKREFATGHDGEKIPLTIIYKKDLKLDGTNRVFQYAYGSYGFGMPASFNSKRIPLLERGFIYVIVHPRGGDDKGHKWYLDGKMMNKKNTFLDFISASKHLIKQGYTSKKKIVANGGSAGGLLMGAVANMAPELYCSIVADVPFVDVLNTISDESLPLTPPEWLEWGNPITNKEHYDYIKSYSPYDNVKAQAYPSMLFNSGISDEQVTYWEPTKMVAKLRELRTDDNLLLLNMKMHSGHAGASKKHESLKEFAFDVAFILKTCP